MTAYTRRDLTIVKLDGKNMVIACDSCGGIGIKDGDVLKLSPYHVGMMTARVGLTEVMCAGAVPITVCNTVSCEMTPTAAEVIRGIKDELAAAALKEAVLTGSTEENINTCMTAVGITVIGIAEDERLRADKAYAGDCFLLIGSPAVGKEVELCGAGFYDKIRYLLTLTEVREIAPVGSRGIAYEAGELARLNGLSFVSGVTDVDLYKSAGPVTCMVVLCSRVAAADIISTYPQTRIIGVAK